MNIQCDISLGELVDKISILKIKLSKISEPTKLKHIKLEHDVLETKLNSLSLKDIQPFLQQLIEINTKLWEVEDSIREEEQQQNFGKKFIDLARSVYRLNDQRFLVKKQINETFGSKIQEQKSYKNY
jgi:hypothetical protein